MAVAEKIGSNFITSDAGVEIYPNLLFIKYINHLMIDYTSKT